MTDPTPYIFLPGTAREALSFYADVFGGATQLHTFAEFNRSDGPADHIAHGYLVDAPVATRSGPPPAPNGSINRTRRETYCSEDAGTGAAARRASSMRGAHRR